MEDTCLKMKLQSMNNNKQTKCMALFFQNNMNCLELCIILVTVLTKILSETEVQELTSPVASEFWLRYPELSIKKVLNHFKVTY